MDLAGAETVFGGVVLILLLTLIMGGKIRLDREVHAKDEITAIHEKTIEKQWETIEAMASHERETIKLLRELRDISLSASSTSYMHHNPQQDKKRTERDRR